MGWTKGEGINLTDFWSPRWSWRDFSFDVRKQLTWLKQETGAARNPGSASCASHSWVRARSGQLFLSGGKAGSKSCSGGSGDIGGGGRGVASASASPASDELQLSPPGLLMLTSLSCAQPTSSRVSGQSSTDIFQWIFLPTPCFSSRVRKTLFNDTAQN